MDHRSDIFVFGAIFFEMLSGQRAFRRDTATETMTAILKEDLPERSANQCAGDCSRQGLTTKVAPLPLP